MWPGHRAWVWETGNAYQILMRDLQKVVTSWSKSGLKNDNIKMALMNVSCMVRRCMPLVQIMLNDDIPLQKCWTFGFVQIKGQGLVKAQQRFSRIIWVGMCWALWAGMLIAPTENTCLETLIPSIHSTHDGIFVPTLLSSTVLMYNESTIVQTTHAHVCYALRRRLKSTLHS
jgi:hypothetical protein